MDIYLDSTYIGKLIVALIGTIALLIAIISFRSYRIIKNWKFMALGSSFLILAAPNILMLLCLDNTFNPLRETGSLLNQIFILLSIFTTVAFILLVEVYYIEKKEASIRFGFGHWLVGSVLAAIQLILLLRILNDGYYLSDSFADPSWSLSLLVSLFSSNLFIIVIIISLIAYYQCKRTTSTLIAINGFSFILISQTFVLLLLDAHAIVNYADFNRGWLFVFIGVTNLVGYLAFFFGIVRLRVSHG